LSIYFKIQLQKKVIRCPDDEAQKNIGSQIKQAHGFVNCVGFCQYFVSFGLPQDWMEENTETEDDEELEQHNERANRHNQILAYMMKTH